jgi:CubicO group peptidase (beta-lactamase class C family)
MRRLLPLIATGLLLATAPSVAGASPSSPVVTAPEPRLDPALLDSVLQRAAALPRLRALIIARDGVTVAERAFRGPGLDRPVNIKSASKSVLSALVGIALERRVFTGLDQPIAPILAAALPADPLLAQVTIDHLLSMRAGLDRTSGPDYGRWTSSPDWVRYILSRPFVDRPGGRMLYSTGDSHLLSAALTRLTGRSTLALMRDWLGRPLGITIPDWPRDPQGIYVGGNDMVLSPRALRRAVPPGRGDRRQAGAAAGLGRGVLDPTHLIALHRPRLWLWLVHHRGARPSGLLRLGLRRADGLCRARSRPDRGHDLGPDGAIPRRLSRAAARPAGRRHRPGGGAAARRLTAQTKRAGALRRPFINSGRSGRTVSPGPW